MTVEEAIKLLAILKAAYPKDFPYNMTVDDAKITAIVWAEQFLYTPGYIVEMAVKQLISTEERCSIPKVKKQIRHLYWEAQGILDDSERIAKRLGTPGMSEEEKAKYESIKSAAKEYRYSYTPSIAQFIEAPEKLMIGE